jgi:hypothetical protein
MDCREALFFLRFRRPGLPGSGDFAPEDAAALDQHIASCPACAAEAKAAIAFDSAVGSAMRAVEIPAGLRDRLFVAASVQRGTRLRRKAYQWAALAASVLLVVGLATGIFTATRPEPDTYELVMRASRVEPMLHFAVPVNAGFNPDLASENQTALNTFLKSEELPPLPKPEGHAFDPALIVSQHFEDVQGRQVPVVLFRGADGGFAKVYAFRSTQFKVKGLAEGQGVSDSNCQAMYFPTERSSVVYVVVFTGRDLTPFLAVQARPGGRPA